MQKAQDITSSKISGLFTCEGVPPVFVTAVRAKVRYKVNHFVVSVLFNNKIYAPHPETQTTKTDHFPAFNKLFRLPECIYYQPWKFGLVDCPFSVVPHENCVDRKIECVNYKKT